MVHSPSKRWENGVLVERAIATGSRGDAVDEEVEPKATKPYKAPVPTKHGPVKNEKRVDSAENKAVTKASKKAASK